MELFDLLKQHSLLEKLFYFLCIKDSRAVLTKPHKLKARCDSSFRSEAQT